MSDPAEERILFVDDDPDLLAAIRRQFHRRFAIATADGGEAGLNILRREGPFAVVVADMRMPGMNGAEFLKRVREIAPDTVRVMLTGYGDLETTMAAVNEGHIFRFLTKPCPPEVLEKTLQASLEQYRLITLVHYLAYHDNLTDLPNRRLFYDRLSHSVAQARRYGQQVAVLFLDLDRFKHINDTLGHATGDTLLQSVAQRLTGCIRESDTIARLGGDEFAVILPPGTHARAAVIVAQRIIEALSDAFVLQGYECFLTTSIGISLYPTDGTDMDALVKHADIAMYRAKGQGGNNFQFYSPAMNAGASERMALETSLRKALEREEFLLYYQPQLDIDTGQIVAVEALIRFSVDDFGTGYSSLSYLKRLPIDMLKIDRSFVRDVTTDPDDAAITTAIIAMAHSLKMKVVAEGVETEEQLTFLRSLQCDQMQGYHLTRPLPADKITWFLQRTPAPLKLQTNRGGQNERASRGKNPIGG